MSAGFLERPAAFRKLFRILALPHLEVGTAVDHRQRPIADVGIEPTERRLRDRQRQQCDSLGFVEVCTKLFYGLLRGGAILDTVFEQLTIVIADVARHVVREEAGPPHPQASLPFRREPRRAVSRFYSKDLTTFGFANPQSAIRIRQEVCARMHRTDGTEVSGSASCWQAPFV